MTLDELGREIPEYRPTFDFQGSFIDSFHEFFSKCPLKDDIFIQIKNFGLEKGDMIEGWLRREDTLKLYEIAHFVRGDILELGSYHGLSTTVLSLANRHSPYPKRIYSVELDLGCVKQTEANLLSNGLNQGVTIICADATDAINSFANESKQFELVFVDHSHAYEPVSIICQKLNRVMRRGGFCLFHDFNDPRNRQDYRIYQAVTEGLSSIEFQFYGIYGCAALYQLI